MLINHQKTTRAAPTSVKASVKGPSTQTQVQPTKPQGLPSQTRVDPQSSRMYESSERSAVLSRIQTSSQFTQQIQSQQKPPASKEEILKQVKETKIPEIKLGFFEKLLPFNLDANHDLISKEKTSFDQALNRFEKSKSDADLNALKNSSKSLNQYVEMWKTDNKADFNSRGGSAIEASINKVLGTLGLKAGPTVSSMVGG